MISVRLSNSLGDVTIWVDENSNSELEGWRIREVLCRKTTTTVKIEQDERVMGREFE